MNVFCFSTGPIATNAYILSCINTLSAVIIDPGVGSYEILLKEIKEKSLKPIAIWLTHSHWDHIGDVAKIKKEFSIPIYIHGKDRDNLENPGSDGLSIPVPKFEGTTPDFLIKEGELLFIGDIIFCVIHTPGHSPGSICFYSEKEKTLISGDTLFHCAIGGIHLPTGEPEQIWPSLDKLSKLPPDTKIFPGHGPKTTLKDEAWLHNVRTHSKIDLLTHIKINVKN